MQKAPLTARQPELTPASGGQPGSAVFGLTTENDAHRLALRQAALLRGLCEFLDQDSLATSLLAICEELRRRFHCERVAAGVWRDDQFELSTLSQQTDFDRKSVEVQKLTAAMREACEQDRLIHAHTALPRARLGASPAHQALLEGATATEICTVPLFHQGEKVGALLLVRTRQKVSSGAMLLLLRQMANLLAPLVRLRVREEAPFFWRLRTRVRRYVESWLGQRGLAGRLAGSSLLLILFASMMVSGTHYVGATAELVSVERRIVSAPFNGFLEAVHVATGAQVQAGQPLLTLDTRDLELERDKWDNEIQGADAELRAAMAGADRKEMAVLQARKRRAKAQLDLVGSHIERASITAPTSGVVNSEDLSQALGAPVERGQVLLEISPQGSYKVVLWVDESDIAWVRSGQPARLSLKASPAESLTLRVLEVHPIGVAKDGGNRFRVDTQLEGEHPLMRPGQTGFGKIEVGEARFLWLWTHRFSDWIRHQAWAWFG